MPLSELMSVLERCGASLSKTEVAAAAASAGAASGPAFVRAAGLETALLGAGQRLDAEAAHGMKHDDTVRWEAQAQANGQGHGTSDRIGTTATHQEYAA